jgi:vacuolar-type H+-ATPase subunit D/Vma8
MGREIRYILRERGGDKMFKIVSLIFELTCYIITVNLLVNEIKITNFRINMLHYYSESAG